MASGNVENMAEQMIVCVYTKGDLLSFTISRPSYDRTQRTSAISDWWKIVCLIKPNY